MWDEVRMRMVRESQGYIDGEATQEVAHLGHETRRGWVAVWVPWHLGEQCSGRLQRHEIFHFRLRFFS